MAEGVFSFHKMQEGCRGDEPAAWLHFVKSYAPLARQLLRHYFPEAEQRGLLAGVWRAAREQGRVWQGFAGTGEKEFVLHFRNFVLAEGRAARGGSPEAPLTPEAFWKVLQEFPPLQRELLALAFHRYAPEELSALLKFDTETAAAVVAQAREKLGAEGTAPDHDALFVALESQRTELCVPDRVYARLVDGQVTWREREEIDRHLENCLYCLNRFAEFREAAHFFHKLAPADDAVAGELAAAMGLPGQAVPKKKPGWWQRLLGA